MRFALLIAVALAACVATAQAGRSCEQRPLAPASIERGLSLAERTARALDASGADVAIVARAGQDLGRWGQTWSHLGIAYRERPPQPSSDGKPIGVWRVVHKLNHCGTGDSAVYRQGLGDFFIDDLWRFDAAIAPLHRDARAPLAAALRSNAKLVALHTRAYSMVAYPWSQRYQQSNQWAIETLASVLEPGASTRERAQAWLKLKDYRPAVLRIDPMTRLGARIAHANVAFDDHPNAKRFAGRIETVTVDSVFDWLERSGLGGPLQVLH